MRTLPRIVLWAVLAGVAPVVAGCSSFDPDSLDIFGLNEKKKLPGERKDLFPEGVPGVSQGIPPEYLRNNQQPAANAGATVPADGAAPQATAAALPAEPEKPKAAPAPKPRRTATRAAAPRPAAAAPVAPVESQPAPAAQQAPAQGWPAPTQQPATAPSGSAAWPQPQPSGTFQR